MADQNEDDVDLELEDEMSIDELAQNWVEAIPRREGLKLVHLSRDHVKRFLAAATINPGTVEAARKLQTRLKFVATVISVPAKPMLELCEAFITTSKPPYVAQPSTPANPPPDATPIGSKAVDSATQAAPVAPDPAIKGSPDAQVDGEGDASEGQKSP